MDELCLPWVKLWGRYSCTGLVVPLREPLLQPRRHGDGGATWAPPAPSVLEQRGLGARGPAQSTLGSSTTGVLCRDRAWEWCWTKGSLAPLASLRCPKKPGCHGPAAGMATCPLCVLALITAQSEQDLSEPFPWAARREGRGYLCDFIVLFCFFVFFPVFWELKVLMGPNP